jgi:transcription elongation factor Elf1
LGATMTEVRVDLHCPACGHEVFTVLEDGFHCVRCGAKAQPYCVIPKRGRGTARREKIRPVKPNSAKI